MREFPAGHRRAHRRDHAPGDPLRIAFDAGCEAGADDTGSGELLAEAQALQDAFYDLDGKTRRAIALDDLVTAVSVETIEHLEGCSCDLCPVLEMALVR
ncbi:MAG: hypothetical protein ACLP9L_03530 [Thermoguttaceae bacterium]